MSKRYLEVECTTVAGVGGSLRWSLTIGDWTHVTDTVTTAYVAAFRLLHLAGFCVGCGALCLPLSPLLTVA